MSATAEVQRGGRTATDKHSIDAMPKSASASRIVAELNKDRSDKGVIYVGEYGHGYLEPPRTIFAQDGSGRSVGSDPGLSLDLQGIGMTRPYYPERNKIDKAYCERLDRVIAEDHPDVLQFHIRKLEPECPPPPVQRWNTMTVRALKTVVEANLGEDAATNVEYVKACARFETHRKDPETGEADVRPDVLAMLDGLLVSEAALTNAFDAEITLK